MAIKTQVTTANGIDFINEFADAEQKRRDSFELLKLVSEFTGFEPMMWGATMIGFGSYHYKSERSRQEGDWPLVGFSPRNGAISLYVFSGYPEHEYLLKDLGKFTMGKACIYIKRLADINIDALKIIMGETIKFLQTKYKSPDSYKL